jgi:hypothetical protein
MIVEPSIKIRNVSMRNLLTVSLLIFFLVSSMSSGSEQPSILVDASRDGGVWWSGKPDHQGKALSDYLRSEGCNVTELPNGTKITPDVFAAYDIVIRASEYGEYSDSEIESYHDFVSSGGGLLLLGDYYLSRLQTTNVKSRHNRQILGLRSMNTHLRRSL